jgi:hypothetical protein
MKKFAMLSLMAVLALGACDDDDDPVTPAQNARIRIVNASTGNASVSAFHGNNAIATNVAFQGAGTCGTSMNVPAGNQTITFRSGPNTTSTQIATAQGTFQANRDYTIVLRGTGASTTATIFEDTRPTTVTANNNAVRIINAQGTAGDVFVTAPAANPTGSPIALAAGAGTTNAIYREFAVANTLARIYATGATTNPRGTFTLANVPANRMATVIFTDAATTGGATGFQLNACP